MSFCNRIFCMCFLAALSVVLSGCLSVTNGSAAGIVSENQRELGRTEESERIIEQYNQFLADRIDKLSESIARVTDNAETIRKTSDSIGDELERLEYLLNQYQLETVRVQRELIQERDVLKAYIKDSEDTYSSISNNDTGKNNGNSVED